MIFVALHSHPVKNIHLINVLNFILNYIKKYLHKTHLLTLKNYSLYYFLINKFQFYNTCNFAFIFLQIYIHRSL